MTTQKLEIGNIISSKFATLNKNDSLESYKTECARPEKEDYTNWRYEDCKIEQYFELTSTEWNHITNNLLEDNLIFREKGGNEYTGEDESVANDEDFWKNETKLIEFRKHNARLVTVLKNKETGEYITVDPQGHNYARYVGLGVI